MEDLFEVQTYTLCDGWINCWTDWDAEGNESPSYYQTKISADEAIRECIDDAEASGLEYSADEFRVRCVNHQKEFADV